MSVDSTANIIYQATAATTLVKAGVDLLKAAWGGDAGRTPTWVPPIASLVSGLGIMALLAVANGQDLSQPTIAAQTALAGIMAAVSAVGITELHKIARPGPGLMPPETRMGWAEPTASVPMESYSPSPRVPAGSPSSGGAPVESPRRSLFG